MSIVHNKEAPTYWSHLSDTWLQFTGSWEQHEECCSAVLLRQKALWLGMVGEGALGSWLPQFRVEIVTCWAGKRKGRNNCLGFSITDSNEILPILTFLHWWFFTYCLLLKSFPEALSCLVFVVSFHQIDWGWVSRVGSAVVPEVNLLPFCLSSILIMFLYPPFHT